MSINNSKPLFAQSVFGCKVNQVESAMLKQQFEDHGFVYTGQLTEANVVLLHTCTVTHKADRDCRRFMDQVRKDYPRAYIVLTGCLASLEKDFFEKQEKILAVVDQKNRYQTAAIVSAKLKSLDERFEFKSMPVEDANEGFFSRGMVDSFSGRARAVVKIQDGCDGRCTYCRVRLARNKLYSKPLHIIMPELQQTIDNGYEEIVLTGVNLGCWQPGLPQLLDEISKLTGVFRIRLTSLEPQHLDQVLIDKLIRYQDRLCPHIHIPIQSGADKILEVMKRTYNAGSLFNQLQQLKERWPGLALTADMIVGFPGESEDEFLASCQLAERLELSRLHVFTFSKRPGTEAAVMPNQLVDRVITERARKMRKLSDQLKNNHLKKLVNQKSVILLEQLKNGYWIGTTGDYEKARIKINGRAGQLINATITGVQDSLLIAEQECSS